MRNLAQSPLSIRSAGVYPPRSLARGTRLRPPERRADFGVASKAPRYIA